MTKKMFYRLPDNSTTPLTILYDCSTVVYRLFAGLLR